MTKFQKRISKLVDTTQHAVVIGRGFEYINEIVEIFPSTFIISNDRPDIKGRNIIFREDFVKVSELTKIGSVFIDIDNIKNLEKIVPLLTRCKPSIVIEGDEVLPRAPAEPIWNLGYRPMAQKGFFHVWKKIQ